MASKLAAAFLRCTLGPLNYAGGCIISGKVPDGLRELSADNLYGGLTRGIQEAAKQVGVGVPDVERLLPMADLRGAAGRLAAAQQAAVAAWGAHAGQLGGLMAGVADLTMDSRAPDVSMFLERLSKKVVRDRPLSEPLHDLSVQVAAWLDLVEHSGELLADGGVLAKAYRRRKMKRAAAAIVAVGLIAAGGAAALWVRSARARIDGALAVADPCAGAGIDPGDLGRASADQVKRAGDRRAACDAQRQREADALAAKKKHEEEVAAAERAKSEREATCAALAAHVESGALEPSDGPTAGDRSGLLGRIAKGSVDRTDLDGAALPCGDTPAGQKLTDAFAKALLASPAVWANADNPSDQVRAILIKHVDELPSAAKQVVARRGDDAAKRALLRGGPDLAAKAVKLCRLRDALGVSGGQYCASLLATVPAAKP